MCKKQTSVSHNSTESEIISLDAGLRLDGKPALHFWDLIVAVLHGNTYQSNQERWDPRKFTTRKKIHGKIDDLDNVDFIPSNVQSPHQEALLYVFEDNEAVIKMIITGRSPTMRHVSRTHRVALDELFDRINLDTKIQIKYIDTKKQFSDILTKGNFTRDEWNHLLCSFNISHFSSINCSEVMLKRTQKDSGEERVTEKSKPMMNLVSRCSARDPCRATFYCIRPVKTRHDSQSPLSPQTEKYDRTVRPVVCAHSSSHSEWNVDKTWSSQEWKSDEVLEARTVRLVSEQPARMFTQHTDKFIVEDDDMDSDTEAESELSLESLALGEWSSAEEAKPILKICNRRRQTFCDMVNVYVFYIASICIHGEELVRQLAFHQRYRRSHNETDARHVWEIDNRTIRRDLWNEYS